MSDISALNMFFGQIPGEEFLEDLSNLKSFKKKEIIELINLLVKWYPKEDIDKEWKEWSKDLKEKEIKKKKAALRVLIFIFKEFIAGNISESELKKDAEAIRLPSEYIDHFIKMSENKEEYRKKVLREERPKANIIVSLNWRIDKRIYKNEIEENTSVIEFTYISKGKKEVVQFDLNIKALRHLISILNKIEEKLCQIQ